MGSKSENDPTTGHPSRVGYTGESLSSDLLADLLARPGVKDLGDRWVSVPEDVRLVRNPETGKMERVTGAHLFQVPESVPIPRPRLILGDGAPPPVGPRPRITSSFKNTPSPPPPSWAQQQQKKKRQAPKSPPENQAQPSPLFSFSTSSSPNSPLTGSVAGFSTPEGVTPGIDPFTGDAIDPFGFANKEGQAAIPLDDEIQNFATEMVSPTLLSAILYDRLGDQKAFALAIRRMQYQGAGGAGARAAQTSVAPTLGSLSGAATGSNMGGVLGGLAGPEGALAGRLIGGLAGGIAGGRVTGQLQDKFLERVLTPEGRATLRAVLANEQQAHPYATHLGAALPGLAFQFPTLSMSPQAWAGRAQGAGMGVVGTGIDQALSGHFDGKELLWGGALGGATYGEQTPLGRRFDAPFESFGTLAGTRLIATGERAAPVFRKTAGLRRAPVFRRTAPAPAERIVSNDAANGSALVPAEVTSVAAPLSLSSASQPASFFAGNDPSFFAGNKRGATVAPSAAPSLVAETGTIPLPSGRRNFARNPRSSEQTSSATQLVDQATINTKPAANPNGYGASVRRRMLDIHSTWETQLKKALAYRDERQRWHKLAAKRLEKGAEDPIRQRAERAAHRQLLEAEKVVKRLQDQQMGRLRTSLMAKDRIRKIPIQYDTTDQILHASIEEGARFVSSVVSNRVAPSLIVDTPTLFAAVQKPNERFKAEYIDTNKGIYLRPNEKPNTSAHELGHWLESRSPRVQSAAFDYYHFRTKGEKLIRLGKGYDDTEFTRPDDFLDKYMGKDYSANGSTTATELISMGIELLYEDPVLLARRDPHYFDFLITTLHGK